MSSTKLLLILITTIILTMPPPQATAQSPAPAPAPEMDCTSYLLNMSDCLSFVEASSNLTEPETGCCPELAGMIGSKPVCLCELLTSADSFGIEINTTKAMELPVVCKISTPPVSSFCSANGFPIDITSPSPAPTSPGDHPGAAGNKDSGSSSINVSQSVYRIGLTVATLSTFFWI